MPDDMSAAQRLDALEALIEELIDTNDAMPILVEGTKDVTALRALGLEGDIRVVNTGLGLVPLVESIHAEGVKDLVLLCDWDRTGGRLQRRLRELCDSHAIRWNDAHRQALVRIVGNEARTVESLASLRESLRRRARLADLEHATSFDPAQGSE